MTSPLTHCISTYNNLPYLKLVVESVRKNGYYKDAPFIIHAENCTDGTDEWLEENAEEFNLEYYIDKNEVPLGIGGGMNFCAERVKTEYINFLHSDFYVSENFDKNLYEYFISDLVGCPKDRLWVCSFRIEPNTFNSPPRYGTHLVDLDTFGAHHHDFNITRFEAYANQFTSINSSHYPKGEGVSGLLPKKLWDEFGGNDPLYAPTSWEDMDLFMRMKFGGVDFFCTTKSVVWHFGARGSHRLEENNGQSSQRQKESEAKNAQKFFSKWGGLPAFDEFGMINGYQTPEGKLVKGIHPDIEHLIRVESWTK